MITMITMITGELREAIILEALDVLSREVYQLPDMPEQEALALLDRIAVLLGIITEEDLQA
jgi:hypothetical protein